MEISMSFPAAIHNLLNHEVKENFITKLLKKHSVSREKQENTLLKLAFMSSFEEISEWVIIHSKGLKFIANPSIASDTDRLDCLFAVQEPLALALKDVEKRRKNGRDGRLIEATSADNYAVIANILASTASTYWQNHGFFNNEKNLKIISFLRNDEKNQQKKDFQKAQLDNIGAAVDFKKALKKGAFQEVFDFEETEEILKNEDFEDFE